jgi:cyclopropane fatty-acyl-phospholipid synthase-like methyltransferase
MSAAADRPVRHANRSQGDDSPRPARRDSTRSAGRRTATTVACYSVFERFFPACGMLDYTEGMYHGDASVPLDVAQRNQIRYVLDEVDCREGTRVLEIGCGNGTLLDEVRQRHARGVGITISPEQVRRCRRRDLDVRLLDYRDLSRAWNGQFDAVIANGPVEHFVQPHQAAAGQDDRLYREFFEIARRVLDPHSPNRRLINTTIHFLRRPEPDTLLRRPREFPRGSDEYHYANLARSFGGWYPVEGQLERCARGCFRQIKTTDGTHDYHLTSEAWLARIRAALRSPEALRLAWRALPLVFGHPRQLAAMVRCMLIDESWNWQFREPRPPTCLLRQTWECVG